MAQGRLPDAGKKRDNWIHARLTEDEMAQVDADRGTLSRSEHARRRLLGRKGSK